MELWRNGQGRELGQGGMERNWELGRELGAKRIEARELWARN